MEQAQEFKRDLLRSHNQRRKEHSARRLRKSKSLSDAAQRWADKLLQEGKYEPSNIPNVGENIEYKFIRDVKTNMPKGSEISELWYSGVKKFDYDAEQYCTGAGKFSQMVWKATKYIGIGIAWNTLGKVVIVVNYKPAGNVAGAFHQNVSNPISISGDVFYSEDSDTGSETEVEEEEECGNLINANVTEDFGAENDGTRFKRTITTKQFLIPVRNGEMTRTIKRTRITYLTKTNLADDFLTQLENLNYELPRSTSNQASEQDKNETDKMVKKQNDFRGVFKLASLERSTQLDLLAAYWANRLLENNPGATTHLIGNPECQRLKVGETIVAEQLPAHKPIDGEKIVDSWFQSRVHYNTSNHEFVPAAGSFTQMLWRDTKEIGIAVARNKNGKAVIVCNYYPPGNIRNEFEQNVPVAVPPEKKLK